MWLLKRVCVFLGILTTGRMFQITNRNTTVCSNRLLEEEEEDSEEKEDSSRLPAVEVDGRGGACVGGGRELEEVKQLTWY